MEDSIDIIAKLPGIAALIYRNTYKGGDVIEADPKLDWAANLSHMMGEPALQKCTSLLKAFQLLQSFVTQPCQASYQSKMALLVCTDNCCPAGCCQLLQDVCVEPVLAPMLTNNLLMHVCLYLVYQCDICSFEY